MTGIGAHRLGGQLQRICKRIHRGHVVSHMRSLPPGAGDRPLRVHAPRPVLQPHARPIRPLHLDRSVRGIEYSKHPGARLMRHDCTAWHPLRPCRYSIYLTLTPEQVSAAPSPLRAPQNAARPRIASPFPRATERHPTRACHENIARHDKYGSDASRSHVMFQSSAVDYIKHRAHL